MSELRARGADAFCAEPDAPSRPGEQLQSELELVAQVQAAGRTDSVPGISVSVANDRRVKSDDERTESVGLGFIDEPITSGAATE